MRARLGNVLYWLGTVIAVLCIGAAFTFASNEGREKWYAVGFFAVFAAVSWGIGRALRYVLAGK